MVARWRRVAIAGVVLGGACAWSVAERPTNFSALLYDRGGVLRTLQVLCTDTLGPRGVLALAFVLLVALVESAHRRRLSACGLVAFVAIGSMDRSSHRGPPFVRPSGPSEAAAEPRHLLLLVARGLRADRIEPTVAPSLAGWAAQSVWFRHAYASHGAREAITPMGAGPHFLPRVLSRLGWTTALVAPSRALLFSSSALGLDEDGAQVAGGPASLGSAGDVDPHRARDPASGFSVVASPGDDPRSVVTEAVLRLEEARAGGKRAFVVAVFEPARAPHHLPHPWYTRFTRTAYRGPFKYDRVDGEWAHALEPADRVQARGLYDGAVAFLDRTFGEMMSELVERKLLEETLVVLTADHGESLDETGRGYGARRDIVGDGAWHVPLLVFDPGGVRPRVVDEIVRDVELAPALTARFAPGTPGAPEGPRASRILRALRGEAIEASIAFARSTSLEGPNPRPNDGHGRKTTGDPTWSIGSAFDGRFKLVMEPTRQGPRWRLFDTILDPSRTSDRAADFPRETERLRAELARWLEADPAIVQHRGLFVPRASVRPSPVGRVANVVWVWMPGLTSSEPLEALSNFGRLAQRGVWFSQGQASSFEPRSEWVASLAGSRPDALGLDRQLEIAAGRAAFERSRPFWLPSSLRANGFRVMQLWADSAPPALRAFSDGFDHPVPWRGGTPLADALASNGQGGPSLYAAVVIPCDPEALGDRFGSGAGKEHDAGLVGTARKEGPESSPGRDDRDRANRALGEVLDAVDASGAADRTMILLSGGPPISGRAPEIGQPRLDSQRSIRRFEALSVPVVLSAPGLSGGRRVPVVVRTVDLAPTVVDALGLVASGSGSGISVLGLAQGQTERDERVRVSSDFGRLMFFQGEHRLVVSRSRGRPGTVDSSLFWASAEEDRASEEPSRVAELRAHLEAALAGVPAAGTAASLHSDPARAAVHCHLRVTAGGHPHRVGFRIAASSGTLNVHVRGHVPGAASLQTTERDAAGHVVLEASDEIEIEVVVDPPVCPWSVERWLDVRAELPPVDPVTLLWDFTLDEGPWPHDLVFGGPLGLASPELGGGLGTGRARESAAARVSPRVPAERELGLFVACPRIPLEPLTPYASAATERGAPSSDGASFDSPR